jgi:diaminopimelate epimerase
MKINFSKATASGNDFVIIDNRQNILKDYTNDLIKSLADRRFGIGADGVILIEQIPESEFSMKYYNSDGFLGSLCGNGARCTAKYIYENITMRDQIDFEALGKKYSAIVRADTVKLFLPDLLIDNQIIDIKLKDRSITSYFINTGSPHAVIFIDSIKKNIKLSEIDVTGLGKEIRYSSVFQPNGTNVNFVNILSNDLIELRTYERGVEDETLACGTGSIASAIISFLSGNMMSPVKVQTRGGETFTVGFSIKNFTASDLFLEGHAKLVYNGYFYYDNNKISGIL